MEGVRNELSTEGHESPLVLVSVSSQMPPATSDAKKPTPPSLGQRFFWLWYIISPWWILPRFAVQAVTWACSKAAFTRGSSATARIMMMAITAISSIRVKPARRREAVTGRMVGLNAARASAQAYPSPWARSLLAPGTPRAPRPSGTRRSRRSGAEERAVTGRLRRPQRP
jgi:hypothetical protein